jgi:hypothetical protein
MNENKLPKYFDVKLYKQLNADLELFSNEKAIQHYLTIGHIEKRKYCVFKTAILFHVGNLDVFIKIFNNNCEFFKRKILIIITTHSINNINSIGKYLPNAIYKLIENKGADIGGFLYGMKILNEHPNYKDIDSIYFIHTKTNDVWRRDLLFPLTTNYLKIEELMENEKNVPIIVGSNKYCRRNKGINRTYIKDIFVRNNIDLHTDWKEYIDDYIDENYLTNKNEPNAINKYTDLIICPSFYKNYEHDLSLLTDLEAIEHYKKFGVNEYYRINNPCYIKKFGKESYFIAGTIFVCNKAYFKVFEDIDYINEYNILECGYVLNTIPRKIHAWEYLFGLLTYTRNGYIISIDNNGNRNIMVNKDNQFNLDIYKSSNKDLIHLNDVDLVRHYYEMGIKEDRIYSRIQLYKPQAIINNNLYKANIAICLSMPSSIDKFNNMLIKIKTVSKNNTNIDIYLGDSINDYNKYLGLSIIKNDLDNFLDKIKNANIIKNFENYNFYLGLTLHRNYNNIIFL